jgi:hypothetical protein
MHERSQISFSAKALLQKVAATSKLSHVAHNRSYEAWKQRRASKHIVDEFSNWLPEIEDILRNGGLRSVSPSGGLSADAYDELLPISRPDFVTWLEGCPSARQFQAKNFDIP